MSKGLKSATSGCVLLSLAFVGYGSYVLYFAPEEPIVSSAIPKITVNKEVLASDITPSEIKPFSGYAEVFKKRDIFKSPYSRQRVKPKPKVENSPVIMVDFEKDYRLVGIVVDDDPKAIMEDIKNKQTLFLSPGDRIEGAVLETIEAERVLFRHNDRLVEIKP